MEGSPEPQTGTPVEKKVKPALKKHPDYVKGGSAPSSDTKRPKKGLKWDEKAIHEHDQLRGTRMKIDEPNTPYTHYDSYSDHEGSDGERRARSPVQQSGELNWDHLNNKLTGVAAAREAYPSSPSSNAGDSDAEEERRRKLRHLEFQQHRKKHYNEFELLKKFRAQNPEMLDLEADDDKDGDGDDEMETS